MNANVSKGVGILHRFECEKVMLRHISASPSASSSPTATVVVLSRGCSCLAGEKVMRLLLRPMLWLSDSWIIFAAACKSFVKRKPYWEVVLVTLFLWRPMMGAETWNVRWVNT